MSADVTKELPVTGGDPRVSRRTFGLISLPLIVLSLIYFFDEFDTAAFGVLAPNIERSFHLSDVAFGRIVIGNISLLLVLVIPLSHYADRLPRRTFAVVLGLVAGTFSFLTGVVGSVGLLILVRLLNGVGVASNSTVHLSLLADYYEPERRGPAFGVHASAVYVGAVLGPASAGAMYSVTGRWQTAFLVLFVPLAVVALIAVRLPEPRRGVTDDPASAREVEDETPLGLREAARTLLAVPTLKRLYGAYVFIGAGYIPLAFLVPLYLQRVYGVQPLGRGLVISANAACTVIGILVSGSLTPRWFAKHPGEPLRWAGVALVGYGFGLLAVALAPNLPAAIVFGLVASLVGGAFTPPFQQVQSVVSPARVRTLSFGFGALFLVVGTIGIWGIAVGAIAPRWNLSNIGFKDYRLALGALLPWWVIGGLMLASAKKFVPADAARALKSLATAVETRAELRSSGERALLKCRNVDVAYDKVQVLFEVDFEVRDGEIVALLGTNGAGKSTLLKAISGLVDPAGGVIFFEGRDVTHLDAVESSKLGIIQMPGGRSVFPTLTVGECLRLATWMDGSAGAGRAARATAEALELFPVLKERRDQLAGNLSGGEQQMLGLAMALIGQPKLLMIDELSLGLAPLVVAQLMEVVKQIHARGTTIILVEQSVNVALTLAQRAVFMEKGEVRFEGPTAELLERGDILRSVFLEGAAKGGAAGNGTVTDGPVANGTRPRRRSGAGTELAKVLSNPVLLELEDVSVRFGGVHAVDGVSLELHEGEVLGLIGPNGAGKTTVVDVVSGFVTLQQGTVRIAGTDVTSWPAHRRAHAGIGRSFQDARLFPSMTVVENIAVGLERHAALHDPFASAFGLPAVRDAETEIAYKVHELVDLLGLGAFRNKFVSELSTGSRRIVDLAMAVANRPSVLILDEPSSGIAQRETEALGPLLMRVKDEIGCALLVIEHDMPLVTSISHRLVALESGRVVTVGPPKDVIAHPDVVASYLGSDKDAVARSGKRATRRRTPAKAQG